MTTFPLPGAPVGTVNLKLVPSDPNWPDTRAMHHVDFGEFYPGEIKTVANDQRVQRALNSGEFELTDEDPNSAEIRQQVAEQKASEAADDLLESKRKQSPAIETTKAGEPAKAGEQKTEKK